MLQATVPAARKVSPHKGLSVRDVRNLGGEKRFSGEPLIGFKIFGPGADNDIFGQGRGGTVFVPGGGFQPFAEELLVERGLSSSRLIFVGWPEAGAVRS